MQPTAEIPRKRPSGPTCRYHVAPPESLTIPLGDINPPERVRSPKFDPGRRLTIACADLFSSPQPGVRLSLLAQLAPLDIAPELLDDDSVFVPVRASVLAPRYVLQTIREVIEEPPPPPGEPPFAGTADPDDLPPETPGEVPAGGAPEDRPAEPAPAAPTQEEARISPPTKPWRPFAGKSRVPTVRPPAAPEPQEAGRPPAAVDDAGKPPLPGKRQSFRVLPVLKRRSRAEQPPKEIPPDSPVEQPPEDVPPAPGATIETAPEAPPLDAPAPGATIETAPEAPPLDAPAPGATIETAPEAPPLDAPAVEPEPVQTSPEPVAGMAPPEAGSGHDEPVGGDAATASGPHEESAAPEPGSGQAAVETTLHVESGEENTLASPCTEKIQELFLTEEPITLDRVLSLCGGLPGIRACILARGSVVLGSHNVPAGIDLVSLTANAAHMLEAVRSSSMRMGLGSIPAITIHSEKGPVSFLHAGDIALLVLHADRGFVPGVRERLHHVVQTLGASPLPLPVESSQP
jgi:predicted regulator of Ras-like GTPase activity (Roadblock/LC7/MglB family)